MECVSYPDGKGVTVTRKLVAYALNKHLQITAGGSFSGWHFLLQKPELSLEYITIHCKYALL